jgi:hypothetical protein
MKRNTALGRTKGGAPIGNSGRTALRREQCNGFAQSVKRPRLGKYVPPCNNGRGVPVDESYSSLLGNSQRANELTG